MKMEDMSLSGLDNSKLEAIAHEIYTELVEDACLGLCFEVHRAVKCGYFFLDDTDPDSMKDFEIVDQPGVDIFGQVYNQWKNKECVCPNCSRSIAASRFAPHLEKCLGMGRNSSRIANRRIASSNNLNKSESDQEDNDDINDNDWSYGSEKKAKKRKSDKVRGAGKGGGRGEDTGHSNTPLSLQNPNSPRRSKSLKHKNGEIGGNPDPFKVSLGWGEMAASPCSASPGAVVPPRRVPPGLSLLSAPPVQQLSWHQLRDAGPRGAADAAHHGEGMGGSQLDRGAPQGMGPRASLPAGLHPTGAGFQAGNGDVQQVLIVAWWLLCLGLSTGSLWWCSTAQGSLTCPLPNSPVPSLPSNAGSSPNTPRRCAPGKGSLAWPCSLWGASLGSPTCSDPMGGGKAQLSAVSHPQVPAVSPAHG
uniref:Ataxin-7-like protein 3 n=2 Tax=Passeriformes TaxID=9126 RepID=A0A8C3MW73_GEOPR